MDDPDWPGVQERTRTLVLEAFQQVHGRSSSKWHTQTVYVKQGVRTRSGWTAQVTVIDDLDTCSQYDKSARWEAKIEIRENGEELEIHGQLEVVECGVARHLTGAEKTVRLG